MRSRKAGFTLVEMLVVVVIAAAVVLLAVPSYKRTQSRARYDAAKGLLIDLGMAVLSLQGDLNAANVSYPGSSAQKLTPSMQTSALNTDASVTTLNVTQLNTALFARDYIPKINFDTSADTYKGYTFYICPSTISNSGCCSGYNSTRTVVCMQDTNADASYQWGRFLEDTSLVRGS